MHDRLGDARRRSGRGGRSGRRRSLDVARGLSGRRVVRLDATAAARVVAAAQQQRRVARRDALEGTVRTANGVR